MPICIWASTQPGKAKKFFASNTSRACSAGRSGARRAIFPSVTAMSSRSTEVALGRTTRAFLISRSNGFSIGVSQSEIRALEIGVVTQIGRASMQDEGTILQDIGAVRHVEALHHVLLDQQKGDPVRVDALNQGEQLGDQQRRQAERGLVEDEQFRLGHQS